jgi:hypothetical protein
MRHAYVLALAVFSVAAQGAIIPTSIFSTEDGPGNAVALPYFMNGSQDKLVRRFNVPDGALITSLNSFKITVTLEDDGDKNAFETGGVAVNRGANLIPVFIFDVQLSQSGPTVFDLLVDPLDFAAVIASIQNNNRVPIFIERFAGDYFVNNIQIEIDANLATPIPEPATGFLGASALVALVAFARRTH